MPLKRTASIYDYELLLTDPRISAPVRDLINSQITERNRKLLIRLGLTKKPSRRQVRRRED